ncbi:hypothetical protein HYH03_004574 [Edaphochlamys debaryana]|uniref:Chromatin modification-related protein EAF6 n=1 Tax=Edaphochlamys debaryana TaxID=47281 RepID=A0A835YGY8_9CHLO|nr:hypothetical protein HYH03_004574 [Edaphochlamys debaryana]|eukprot:KAG2497419.1 hypothetical protein HYH03_004574 [Edaphochlamys debaryana]
MSSVIDEYQALKASLDGDLGKIERLMAEMEHSYLTAEYNNCGTVLKGFEGYLNSKDILRKKTRTFKPEDRLFSLSSKSSPVTREMEQPALEQFDSMTPLIPSKKYAQKGYAQKGKRA